MLAQHTNMTVFLLIVILCMIIAEEIAVVSNSSDGKNSLFPHLSFFKFGGFHEKLETAAELSIVILLYALTISCLVLRGYWDILRINGKYLFQYSKFDEESWNRKIMKNTILALKDTKSKLSFSWPSSSLVLVYPAHLERYFKDLFSNNTDNLMKYEWARYFSFNKFPVETPVMPSTLASLGFYYVGPYDQVQCFSCQLVYGNWKLGDDPLEIHKRFSSNCTFVLENGSLNVAIHDGRINNVDKNLVRADNDGNKGAQGGCADNQVSDVENQTINNTCKDRRYMESAFRLSSYNGWTFCGDIPNPEELAEAGFCYAGFNDSVFCFCCGLELRDWKYGDGAWSEHARWSANCLYLRQNKSLEFIKKYKEDPNNDAALGAACAGDKYDLQIKVNAEYKEKHVPEDQNYTHVAYHNDVTRDNADTEQLTEEVVEMGSEQNLVANEVGLNGKRSDVIKSDRKLKNHFLCKICMDKNACVVLLPCGHMIACETCSSAMGKCAICREEVRESVIIHSS